jgi:hypothetical protein
MESRASRGLLHGLEEDEAVTAQGDITVGASSSRVIYHLHWSPFLKPNRVEPLEVQAQGLVHVSKYGGIDSVGSHPHLLRDVF